MSMNRAARYGTSGLVTLAMVTAMSATASAQEPADPNPSRITVTGGVDFLNAYAFRGIRQDDTGVTMWPYANLGLLVYSGDKGLKTVSLKVGTWNSLHSGVAGSDGPSGERWYESDVHATLSLGLAGGVTVGTTYTAYTSPNSMFTAVKEIAVRLAADDRATLGGVGIRPYVLAAFELDTKPGVGQVDGGFDAGKYLEVGMAPGFTAKAVGIAFPVKVGLSLGGYYELAGKDNRFGYASAAGVVTVPLGGTTSLGAWNVHGGLEYQALGETTKVFNGGDDSKVIGSIGVGWSR